VRWAPAAALLLAGCAPALRSSPPPAADERDPAASLAAIQAIARRIEAEHDARTREALVTAAIDEGRRCEARAPDHPECDYGLALALGLQARERPSTAADGLKRMIERLRRAQAAAAGLDSGGPSRVLALLLLRAPGWPLGPGDPEAALAEARKAVALFPDYPPNQLALAEALLTTGEEQSGRAAARQALDRARLLEVQGNREASKWVEEAQRLVASPGAAR